MRWEILFADLEAQLAAADDAVALAGEMARAEVAKVALLDRLRAHEGAALRVRVRGGSAVTGELVETGADWVLLREGAGTALVPVHALAAVSGLSRAVAPPAGPVARRLRLPVALRALARDRAAVRLSLDGHDVVGTIDRVGADHLDLAEHAADEPRRARAVRDVVSVPLAALRVVRSAR